MKAAEGLRAKGYEIQLPADLDKPESIEILLKSPDGELHGGKTEEGRTWGEYLADDVKLVADHVAGLIFIDGWEKSRGARLEAYVGLLCGRPMWFYDVDAGGLEVLPPALVAGVCAAQWVPEATLKQLGLAA
jgi:hypothetical protein